MNLNDFSSDQSQEVIKLFTEVFSDSEGQEEGKAIGQLVKNLIGTTDAKDLFGYTGSLNGNIVGCIFFSRLILPSNKVAFILSPVAIDTQVQGQGLGQQLLSFGIQQLRSDGVELLFTYGDPEFYSKVGFQNIAEGTVEAPRKLTYPDGWLAQALTTETIASESGAARCVDALNKQEYW